MPIVEINIDETCAFPEISFIHKSRPAPTVDATGKKTIFLVDVVSTRRVVVVELKIDVIPILKSQEDSVITTQNYDLLVSL